MTEKPPWVKVDLKYPVPGVPGVNNTYCKYMTWIALNNVSHNIVMPAIGFPDFVYMSSEDAIIFKIRFGL